MKRRKKTILRIIFSVLTLGLLGGGRCDIDVDDDNGSIDVDFKSLIL